jgi:DTW domain-containing protein YfiP
MALRERELAKAKREFKARGSKVKRCASCLLPLTGCICAHRPAPIDGSAFCFIMYRGEAFKPSNTGRLVADVMQENHAFLWDRTQPDPALLALLKDPQYRPIVVFPHQYADESRWIHTPEANDIADRDKKTLFVMLDGTWREAKKMFRSAYLDDFPVLSMQLENKPHYQLRESIHHFQLCTAEVARLILQLGQEDQAAKALGTYFQVFRRQYIAGKPHMVFLEDVTTNPES